MNVLLVGSGGREAALAWALRHSDAVQTLRAAPGNAGMSRVAERVPIPAGDVDALAAHALEARYDLVVIGPEAPLVLGLADRLRASGLRVFGPDAPAARLEGSKVAAKSFMDRHGIPTAPWRSFDEAREATRYLLSEEAAYPLVVKADGLAAGKGVVIADEPEAAVEAADAMLSGRAFGAAGSRIVVEERLLGREASFFVLTDGERVLELATCQDYKRLHDADTGPNTGGMGAYSPSAWLDEASRRFLHDEVALRTIRGLAAEGAPYRGVLYIGAMLTERGPRVLEYNVRFGDPETQVLIPRLRGDGLPLLLGCAEGDLGGLVPSWRDEVAVCVVLASKGYPSASSPPQPIEGLDRAAEVPGVLLFHAATELDAHGRVVTAGGRVLGVTALGADLAGARDRAYEAAACITWPGMQRRTDIATDAIERLARRGGETDA